MEFAKNLLESQLCLEVQLVIGEGREFGNLSTELKISSDSKN